MRLRIFSHTSFPRRGWFSPPHISLLDECRFYSVEIPRPFGSTLTRGDVEAWLTKVCGDMSEERRKRFAWTYLGREDTPEETRFRILLVIPADSAIIEEDQDADLLLPAECAGLACSERLALERRDFIAWWRSRNSWHVLIYRDGLLQQWISETLPEEDAEQWIETRRGQITSFAREVYGLGSDQWLEMDENPKPRDWEHLWRQPWLKDLDLRTASERKKWRVRDLWRCTTRHVLLALWLCLTGSILALGALELNERHLSQRMAELRDELVWEDSVSKARADLRSIVDSISKYPALARGPAGFSDFFYGIGECLPQDSRLLVADQKAEGVSRRWFFRVSVANWDSAAIFQQRLERQFMPAVVKITDKRLAEQERVRLDAEIVR